MNALINKLEEIDFIINMFENQMYLDDINNLKIEFNKVLFSLRKNTSDLNFKYNFYSPQDIIDKMVEICNYRTDFATNKARNRKDFAMPRQYAQTICRHVFKNLSLNDIGTFFVNSDHATILHSNKTVKNLVQTNKKVRIEFEQIQEKILGYVFINF